MTELHRMLHTFHACPQPDGSTVLQLFRRADLREVQALGFMLVQDKTVEARKLGEIICEALDRERVTRNVEGNR